MTKIDHFESDFKSAAKAVYEHGPIKLDRVLVVSDESRAAARTFERRLQDFLKQLGGADKATWSLLTGDSFRGTESLLSKMKLEKGEVFTAPPFDDYVKPPRPELSKLLNDRALSNIDLAGTHRNNAYRKYEKARKRHINKVMRSRRQANDNGRARVNSARPN